MLNGNNSFYQNMYTSIQNGEGEFLMDTNASNLTTKDITENGTYNASSDNADGYSSVNVNVAAPTPETFDVTLVCDASTTTFTTDKSYDAVKAAIQANKVINFIWSIEYQGSTEASGTSSAVSYDSEGDLMGIVASSVIQESSGCYVFLWGNPEVYTTVSKYAYPVFRALN